MKREIVRLDNVWGVGGGLRPVKHLVKEVSPPRLAQCPDDRWLQSDIVEEDLAWRIDLLMRGLVKGGKLCFKIASVLGHKVS